MPLPNSKAQSKHHFQHARLHTRRSELNCETGSRLSSVRVPGTHVGNQVIKETRRIKKTISSRTTCQLICKALEHYQVPPVVVKLVMSHRTRCRLGLLCRISLPSGSRRGSWQAAQYPFPCLAAMNLLLKARESLCEAPSAATEQDIRPVEPSWTISQ